MEKTSGLWVRAFCALFFSTRLFIEWSNGNVGWAVFYAAGAGVFLFTLLRQWRLQRQSPPLSAVEPSTGLNRED